MYCEILKHCFAHMNDELHSDLKEIHVSKTSSELMAMKCLWKKVSLYQSCELKKYSKLESSTFKALEGNTSWFQI